MGSISKGLDDLIRACHFGAPVTVRLMWENKPASSYRTLMWRWCQYRCYMQTFTPKDHRMECSLLASQHSNHALSDLLGPYPIDDRVEGRWKYHIDVGNKNVDVRGYFLTKSMSEEREERGCVENQHDCSMGATSAQCLVTCILGFEVENGMKDVPIGDSNQYEDKDKEGSSKETIDGIDSNVGTSQLGNAHVLTVGVGNNTGIAEGQTVNEVHHG